MRQKKTTKDQAKKISTPREGKTASQIRQVVPVDRRDDIPEDILSMANDLDGLSVWAEIANSDVGKKFSQEINKISASRIISILNNYKNLEPDLVLYELAELSSIVKIVGLIEKSSDEYEKLEAELDGQVKSMLEIMHSVTNRRG